MDIKHHFPEKGYKYFPWYNSWLQNTQQNEQFVNSASNLFKKCCLIISLIEHTAMTKILTEILQNSRDKITYLWLIMCSHIIVINPTCFKCSNLGSNTREKVIQEASSLMPEIQVLPVY